jgi:hypothetical protein
MLITRMASLSLCLVLGGCAVQSSQLSALKNIFFSEPNNFTETSWDVQFGGYAANLQPVSVDGGTVFVSSKQDAISFDGWKITKISGLNSFDPPWYIEDLGAERFFRVNDQVIATHQCEQWLRQNIETGIKFEQRCSAINVYKNTILIDNQGQITSIEQVVDSSLMVMRLRFNN